MLRSADLFCEILREAQSAGELVCIYRDPFDLSRFAAGFVEAVSENGYTLRQIDPDGNEDGFDAGALDDVIEIRMDTRYARQISLLTESLNNHKMFTSEIKKEWQGNRHPGSCLDDMLKISMNKKQIVNVLLDSTEDRIRFYGIVRDISDTHARIDILSDDGEPDGTTVIRLEDIAGLQISTRNEHKVALFYENRMHLYL